MIILSVSRFLPKKKYRASVHLVNILDAGNLWVDNIERY